MRGGKFIRQSNENKKKQEHLRSTFYLVLASPEPKKLKNNSHTTQLAMVLVRLQSKSQKLCDWKGYNKFSDFIDSDLKSQKRFLVGKIFALRTYYDASNNKYITHRRTFNGMMDRLWVSESIFALQPNCFISMKISEMAF